MVRPHSLPDEKLLELPLHLQYFGCTAEFGKVQRLIALKGGAKVCTCQRRALSLGLSLPIFPGADETAAKVSV